MWRGKPGDGFLALSARHRGASKGRGRKEKRVNGLLVHQSHRSARRGWEIQVEVEIVITKFLLKLGESRSEIATGSQTGERTPGTSFSTSIANSPVDLHSVIKLEMIPKLVNFLKEQSKAIGVKGEVRGNSGSGKWHIGYGWH